MKITLKGLILALAGLVCWGTQTARADIQFSASIQIGAVADFYGPLGGYGTWEEIDSYGRCWRPASVAVGWQPYTEGHWVWTDVGWYWESDEPWSWACYHYGNWVRHPRYGWIWLPGTEWAPAWVSWRSGGGYIGWAPLPPTRFSISFGAPQFCFVETRRFHQPHRHNTVIVNNTTIINQTTVINNSVRTETRTIDGSRQQVRVNNGPNVQEVEKASGQTVQREPIQRVAQKADTQRRRSVPADGKTAQPATTATPSGTVSGKASGDVTVPAPKQVAPSTRGAETPRETKEKRSTQAQESKERESKPKKIAPKPEPPAPVNPTVPPVNPEIPPTKPVEPMRPLNPPANPTIPPLKPVPPANPTVPPSKPVPPANPVVPPPQPLSPRNPVPPQTAPAPQRPSTPNPPPEQRQKGKKKNPDSNNGNQ
jgi:hypothetical protein